MVVNELWKRLEMRVAIVGSRHIDDSHYVFPHIARFIKEHTFGSVTIVSGGAKGVDSLAKEYAKQNGLDFIEFQPYHVLDKTIPYEKKFFFVRNRQIIDNCDKVLAFWDGVSSGTEHAIKYAQKHNKPVMIIK